MAPAKKPATFVAKGITAKGRSQTYKRCVCVLRAEHMGGIRRRSVISLSLCIELLACSQARSVCPQEEERRQVPRSQGEGRRGRCAHEGAQVTNGFEAPFVHGGSDSLPPGSTPPTSSPSL